MTYLTCPIPWANLSCPFSPPRWFHSLQAGYGFQEQNGKLPVLLSVRLRNGTQSLPLHCLGQSKSSKLVRTQEKGNKFHTSAGGRMAYVDRNGICGHLQRVSTTILVFLYYSQLIEPNVSRPLYLLIFNIQSSCLSFNGSQLYVIGRYDCCLFATYCFFSFLLVTALLRCN